MWLFTRHGFFSVVCGRADGGKGRALDTETMMIRGRRRAELEALVAACPELAGAEVVEDRAADYRYRLIVGRDAWLAAAARLAGEVDYGNFKSEAARHTGGDYAHALHDVWQVMYDHQRAERDG